MKKSWILYGIGILLILCLATSMLTIVPNQSQEIKTLTAALKDTNDKYDLLKTSIISLETELANCKAANLNLQKPIDQRPTVATSTVKEPVSDDWETYIYEDPCGSIPPKYIEWKINDIQCGTARTDKSRQTLPFCMIMSTITNNHPTLSMVDISINDVTIASANPCATRIDPNQNCTSIKSVELAGYISQKLILKWRWQ